MVQMTRGSSPTWTLASSSSWVRGESRLFWACCIKGKSLIAGGGCVSAAVDMLIAWSIPNTCDGGSDAERGSESPPPPFISLHSTTSATLAETCPHRLGRHSDDIALDRAHSTPLRARRIPTLVSRPLPLQLPRLAMSEVNPTGQWKESLSLEETNKVRISLGLKPLKDPNPPSGPTDEERILEGDELAEHNFRKRQEQERREVDEKNLRERIDKARNQKERQRKLTGRGLGEAGEDELDRDAVKKEEGEPEPGDTKQWIKRQKKRAKELAQKRAKEQEEMDRLALEEERDRADKYGEKDLRGIKVSHGADAFEEGEEHVLTLKDSKILDDEGELCLPFPRTSSPCRSVNISDGEVSI